MTKDNNKNKINTNNVQKYNKLKNIDINKKIFIIKNDDDLRKFINKENLSEKKIEKIKLEIENSCKQNDKQQKTILIPSVKVCDDYNYLTATFEKPAHYIRYELYKDQVSGIKLSDDTIIHYDLLKEDEIFLQKLNHCSKIKVTDDDFCKLIDKFEKLTGKWVDGTEEIDFKEALGVATDLKIPYKSNIIKEIYIYWKKKRKNLGKPLLRMLWTSSHNNLPNYSVFRPRVKEKMTLRKPKKKNIDTIIKMQKLIEDLKKIDKILKKLRQRDEKKLLLLQLNAILFDQRKNEIIDKTYICPMWNYFRDYKIEKMYKKFKKDKYYKNIYNIKDGQNDTRCYNENFNENCNKKDEFFINYNQIEQYGNDKMKEKNIDINEKNEDYIKDMKKIKISSKELTNVINYTSECENVVLIKRKGRCNRFWIDRKHVAGYVFENNIDDFNIKENTINNINEKKNNKNNNEDINNRKIYKKRVNKNNEKNQNDIDKNSLSTEKGSQNNNDKNSDEISIKYNVLNDPTNQNNVKEENNIEKESNLNDNICKDKNNKYILQNNFKNSELNNNNNNNNNNPVEHSKITENNTNKNYTQMEIESKQKVTNDENIKIKKENEINIDKKKNILNNTDEKNYKDVSSNKIMDNTNNKTFKEKDKKIIDFLIHDFECLDKLEQGEISNVKKSTNSNLKKDNILTQNMKYEEYFVNISLEQLIEKKKNSSETLAENISDYINNKITNFKTDPIIKINKDSSNNTSDKKYNETDILPKKRAHKNDNILLNKIKKTKDYKEYSKLNKELFQFDEMIDPLINRENDLFCLQKYAETQKKIYFYLEHMLNFDNFNFKSNAQKIVTNIPTNITPLIKTEITQVTVNTNEGINKEQIN